MVTIHDLTSDDDRLLELFSMLDGAAQSDLIRRAAVLACAAEPGRTQDPSEAAVLAMLWKCRPPLPCGWASDTDFEFEVEQGVCARLGARALDMVAGTSGLDSANAATLAGWAAEQAARVGPAYCAPGFEDGYVSAEAMQRFIEDWRDAFLGALRNLRLHAQQDRRPG